MSPFFEKDIIIIKQQDNLDDAEFVVGINKENNNIMIYKVKLKINSSNIWLQPLDDEEEPIIFEYKDLKNISIKIIGAIKQMKRVF